MRGVRDDNLKQECIRLRVEGRLSLNEIQDKTGASKGSLSGWLTGYPLTSDEIHARRRVPKGGTPKKDRGEESVLHRMAQGRQLSPLQKAKVAEAAVLIRLVVQGFTPFSSMFDGDKTDWLVEIPETGRILKIQVKLAHAPEGPGLPSVSLRCHNGGRKHRKYREGEFDFVVGYNLFTDTCYVWSWADVTHLNNSVTVDEKFREGWGALRQAPASKS